MIEGRQGVIDDWRESMRNDYRWRETPVPVPPPAPPAFTVGQTIYVVSEAYLRRSPGYSGKPQGDVLATLPVATACTVLAGPEMRRWAGLVAGALHGRWAGPHRLGGAQTTPGGATLLSTRKPPTPVDAAAAHAAHARPRRPRRLRRLRRPALRSRSATRCGTRRSSTCAARQASRTSRPTTSSTRSRPARQLTITGGPQTVDGLTLVGCALCQPVRQPLRRLGGRGQGIGRAVAGLDAPTPVVAAYAAHAADTRRTAHAADPVVPPTPATPDSGRQATGGRARRRWNCAARRARPASRPTT